MKKTMKTMNTILSLLLVVSLTACGTAVQKPTVNPEKAGVIDLKKDLVRSAGESGKVTEEFKTAMADFSFELLENTLAMQDEKTNKLISPLSALLALSMTANGAAGETRTQMEKVFGMDVDSLNRALYAYVDSISGTEDAKFSSANSIWYRNNDQKLHVEKDFLQETVNWYRSDLYAAPFDQETVKSINGWCADKTDNMIKKVVEQLDDSVMMLINALVFDAKWAVEYEEKYQIHDEEFANGNGTESKVSMMFSDEHIYLSDGTAKGMIKGYKGGKFGFAGLLPEDEKTDIYEFAKSLSGEKWMNLWNTKEYDTVMTIIPEFKGDDRTSMTEMLKVMGMADAFDPAKADFSRMGSYDGGNLCIGSVNQLTHIEVDRHGTKAAAVTEVEMKAGSAFIPEAKMVYLNRPFVYMIVDMETGLPIFTGVVDRL